MKLKSEIKKTKEIMFDSDIQLVKNELYGVFSSLILSKNYAPQNKDLENIMSLFQFAFKDYVFKSRTILLSRVIRIIESKDEQELKKLIITLLNYLENNDSKTKSVSKEEKVDGKKITNKKKKNIFDDIFDQLG